MSAYYLAKLAGVSRNTISKIENGQSVPSVLLAADLAFYLGVPLHKLFNHPSIDRYDAKFNSAFAEVATVDSLQRRFDDLCLQLGKLHDPDMVNDWLTIEAVIQYPASATQAEAILVHDLLQKLGASL